MAEETIPFLPIIVACAVAVPEVISLVASLLNRTRIGQPPPAELKDIYDPDEYKTSNEYTSAKSDYKLCKDVYDMVFFFGFWFAGGFPWLDGIVVGMGYQNEIKNGLIFVGITTVAGQILDLPWDVYMTFVLEESFGFNKTTPFTFVKDRIKGLALMGALGTPLLTIVLWFFESMGSSAWFYVWLVITAFQVVLLFLSPVLIIPLFMQMIPLPDGTALMSGESGKEMPPIFSARLFYKGDEQVAEKPAWVTKDSRFAGKSNGATLSICWQKPTSEEDSKAVWCLSEGQLGKEGQVVYATCEADLTADEQGEKLWTFTEAGKEQVEAHKKAAASEGKGAKKPLAEAELKTTTANVGSLKKKLMTLADKVGYHGANIYVIDGSTRSSHSNAFCTGFGRFRRICLFDTLLPLMSEDECVSVLGHEIGHDRLYHVHTRLVFSIAYLFIMLFLLGSFLYSKTIASAFYIPEPKVYLGVVLFSIVWGVVDFFVSIPLTVQSRSNEYEADQFAVEADPSYGPLLGVALKKLMKKSKVNLTPHPFQVFLTYSHPPLDSRLNAIREKQAKFHPKVKSK